MSESHHILIKTNLAPKQESETAVAYATKWLLDCVGDIDVFNEVGTKTRNGSYNVHFFAHLSQEQVKAINDSDHITHLEVLD